MAKNTTGQWAAFLGITGIFAAAVVADVTHEVELDQTFHANALSHSIFGYTVDASNIESGNQEFTMDNRDVEVGECFKPTVSGYYTNNAFFFLDISYPTENVKIVPCPSDTIKLDMP